MSRFSQLREQVRQLRYPPEFRIPAEIVAPAGRAGPLPPPEPVPSPTDLGDGVLADLATSLWRTKRKIDANGEPEPPRAQRAAARHLQAAWETLADAGVEILDFDGMPFHPGLALDVLNFEKRPGVVSEIVLETVRPAVYRSGRCIQMGQVIVAQPEEGQANGARNH